VHRAHVWSAAADSGGVNTSGIVPVLLDAAHGAFVASMWIAQALCPFLMLLVSLRTL